MPIALLALLALPRQSFAQRVTLHNNLLYDATLSPNLGLEARLDSTWSLGVDAGFNFWDLDSRKDKKWRHVLVAPYVRAWIDTTLQRRFIEVNAIYSHFNVGNVKFPFGLYKSVRNERRQGDLAALGASIGRNWRLSHHWHLEAKLGAAVGYAWYKQYDCGHCGTYRGKDHGPFVVPQAALNLVYLLGRKPQPAAPQEEEVLPPPPPVVEVPPFQPVWSQVADNTGRAGMLEHDNPVLEHISKYRPYDSTRILRKERGALYVYFPLGQSRLDHDFRGNAPVLDRIADITRQIMADSTSQVKRIQLIGLASVEGSQRQNNQLATDRALALKRYLQQQVPTPDSLYEAIGGGEAWTEFRDQLADLTADPAATQALSADAIRQAIDIIDTTSDTDLRKRLLQRQNGGRTWAYIKQHILADQRNSGYIRIYYDYVPDSCAAIINSASQLLRQQQYAQALQLLQGARNDERAQNALGVALWMTGSHDEALACFRRAAAGGNADARRNLRQIEEEGRQ